MGDGEPFIGGAESGDKGAQEKKPQPDLDPRDVIGQVAPPEALHKPEHQSGDQQARNRQAVDRIAQAAWKGRCVGDRCFRIRGAQGHQAQTESQQDVFEHRWVRLRDGFGFSSGLCHA